MRPPPPGLVGKTSLLQQLDYLGERTIFLTAVTLHKISMDISMGISMDISMDT